MSNVRVTISAAARFWSEQAALAAQEHAMLRYWVTGAPDHKGRGVDPAHIRYIMPPLYIRFGLDKVLPGVWGQHTAYNIGDNLYDLLARSYATDCDVFHVYNHHGLWSMRRAAKQGIKTVVERASAHILTQHDLLRDEFARYGVRFPDAGWPMEWKHIQEYLEADRIVVTSEFVKRTMVNNGIPAEKMAVIGLGVDLNLFQPQPKQDDVFRVVFTGNISAQKGIPYLLQAFSDLRLPNSELVLVGGVFPEMRRVMSDFEATYRFVPGVAQSELVSIYNSASVFVMPSIQDGFGMSVAEAMACAKPVIISENVGIPVVDGAEGFVVPIRSAAAIAEKLTYLHENPAARERMGEAARQRAQSFTWANYRRDLVALYRTLAEG